MKQEVWAMPMEIKDVDGGLGNLITGHGVVRGQEYLNLLEDHFSQDPRKFKKYLYSLCDLTQVSKLEVDSNDIELAAKMSRQASEINLKAVVAVASDKDITFGMSRMWEILFDEKNWEVMVFRNREDAEKWIRSRVKEKNGIDGLTMA